MLMEKKGNKKEVKKEGKNGSRSVTYAAVAIIVIILIVGLVALASYKSIQGNSNSATGSSKLDSELNSFNSSLGSSPATNYSNLTSSANIIQSP